MTRTARPQASAGCEPAVRRFWTALRGLPSRLWADRGWRTALLTFLVLRVVLSLWVWGVRAVYDAPLPPHPVLRPYVGVEPETGPWLEPWQRWDTLHYQAIAERGYRAFDTALFVPPLYPLLIRGAAVFTGGDTLLAGIMISNLAFLATLAAFYQVVIYETRDEGLATRAVVYLASFPAAFFLVAAYTEPVFLLTALQSLSAARRGRWRAAGLWGAAAALTRLPGALVVVPLTWAAWRSWRVRGSGRSWAAPALTGLGAAVFPLYVWLVLRLPPWAPLEVQSARFQGGLSWPGANLWEAARRILGGGAVVADYLDLVTISVFLLMTLWVWRRQPRLYGVYYLSFLLLFLVRKSGLQPLLGTARYVLALYPAFLELARLGANPWVNRLVLYLSWLGLLFMSGQFAIWGWVG